MHFTTRDSMIEFNEDLISQIVYAISKAVSEDAPEYRREHYLETNNAAKFIVGDYINDNLRHSVVNDGIRLHSFKRYSWDGRLLIDHIGKITYTIVSQGTLDAAPFKHGRKPYYLQSILFAENGSCVGQSKQMSFADFSDDVEPELFSPDVLEDDYGDILQGEIEDPTEYRHYVISYRAERSELIDVELIYFDPDYDVVDRKNLNEYITPDFAQLTSTYDDDVAESADTTPPVVTLKLKDGVKPLIRAVEEEA